MDCAQDGAGLACGVFKHFLSLDQNRPKFLGATHIHEIFENGFVDHHPFLQFGHMMIHVDKKAQKMENQIAYLYRCIIFL